MECTAIYKQDQQCITFILMQEIAANSAQNKMSEKASPQHFFKKQICWQAVYLSNIINAFKINRATVCLSFVSIRRIKIVGRKV